MTVSKKLDYKGTPYVTREGFFYLNNEELSHFEGEKLTYLNTVNSEKSDVLVKCSRGYSLGMYMAHSVQVKLPKI